MFNVIFIRGKKSKQFLYPKPGRSLSGQFRRLLDPGKRSSGRFASNAVLLSAKAARHGNR